MNNYIFTLTKTFILISVVITLTANTSDAQGNITFKVNLKPQLEDSSFVLKRDVIYLKGDIFPLTNTRKVYLKDIAPVDSIYETTVNFPPSANGERLTYNFFIETSEEEMTEEMPRYLKIRSKTTELGPFFFNSFAW